MAASLRHKALKFLQLKGPSTCYDLAKKLNTRWTVMRDLLDELQANGRISSREVFVDQVKRPQLLWRFESEEPKQSFFESTTGIEMIKTRLDQFASDWIGGAR